MYGYYTEEILGISNRMDEVYAALMEALHEAAPLLETTGTPTEVQVAVENLRALAENVFEGKVEDAEEHVDSIVARLWAMEDLRHLTPI